MSSIIDRVADSGNLRRDVRDKVNKALKKKSARLTAEPLSKARKNIKHWDATTISVIRELQSQKGFGGSTLRDINAAREYGLQYIDRLLLAEDGDADPGDIAPTTAERKQ